nr:unnamed protein product [Digitaria exilis]
MVEGKGREQRGSAVPWSQEETAGRLEKMCGPAAPVNRNSTDLTETVPMEVRAPKSHRAHAVEEGKEWGRAVREAELVNRRWGWDTELEAGREGAAGQVPAEWEVEVVAGQLVLAMGQWPGARRAPSTQSYSGVLGLGEELGKKKGWMNEMTGGSHV